jgi:hypothetical protein
MPAPTPEKDWIITPNISITPSGVAETDIDNTFLLAKAVLKTGPFPWIPVASSNGSAVDTSDLLITAADIVHALPGSAHSWGAYRQPGINTDCSFLIDFNSATNKSLATVYFSPSAGFTGGSTTARATATDEQTLGTTWIGNLASSLQTRSTVWQSADGECTRVAFCHSDTLVGYWHFDKPKNPRAGWTDPAIGFANGVNVGDHTLLTVCTSNVSLFTPWFNNSDARFQAHCPAGNMPLRLTFEGPRGALDLVSQAHPGVHSATQKYPIMPVGLAHFTTAGRTGRHGTVFDWWWVGDFAGIPRSGAYIPDDPALRLVVIGNSVHPWLGDGTQFLMS